MILKDLSSICKNEKEFRTIKKYLDENFFSYLEPTFEVEARTLEDLHSAVKKDKKEAISPLAQKSEILYALRNSHVFKATPQMNIDDLSNIQQVVQDMNCNNYVDLNEELSEKEWLVKSLQIDYNYNLSLEEYLDIIIPRKNKINRLLNSFLENKKEDSLSGIKAEIWKINKEISNSKALETFTFSTDFAHNNWKILLGMMVGGLIGYSSASFAGCTVGGGAGLIGGIADRIVQKKGAFKIPNHPTKTTEWIKGKIEDPQEKLIATILLKDIKTVQIWNLRRKIKRA